MQVQGKLIVVSGPSGVGKSTIVQEVLRRSDAVFSVSATTRQPRQGEVDGREYRFLNRETFERMIEADKLLEWAEVFGQLYGTPAEPVSQAVKAGQAVLLEIDVQGALQVYKKMPNAEFILIEPPSEDILRKRLDRRGTEDKKSFQRRFGKAKEELETAHQSGAYKHIIVNDDLETAIEQVMEIISS